MLVDRTRIGNSETQRRKQTQRFGTPPRTDRPVPDVRPSSRGLRNRRCPITPVRITVRVQPREVPPRRAARGTVRSLAPPLVTAEASILSAFAIAMNSSPKVFSSESRRCHNARKAPELEQETNGNMRQRQAFFEPLVPKRWAPRTIMP